MRGGLGKRMHLTAVLYGKHVFNANLHIHTEMEPETCRNLECTQSAEHAIVLLFMPTNPLISLQLSLFNTHI
jgi:hypothetical protein